MTTDLLLGFDARETWLDRARAWGAAWKPGALLRRDVEKPLSIDRHVWPSLFDLLGHAEPAYTGLFDSLWASLDRLERHLAALPPPERQPAIVAFTRIPAPDEEPIEADEWAAGVSPETLGRAWSFAGYDVADTSATSGIVTMRGAEAGVDPERYRSAWAPDLNRWHLFRSPARARDFARYSDRAIPEHAPFEVYGVWLRGMPFPSGLGFEG